MTSDIEVRNLIFAMIEHVKAMRTTLNETAEYDVLLAACQVSSELGRHLIDLEALDRLHQTPAGQDIGGPFVPESVR